MSGDNVDYLAKQSSLLDEASKEIIKSLQTKRGSHARFLLPGIAPTMWRMECVGKTPRITLVI